MGNWIKVSLPNHWIIPVLLYKGLWVGCSSVNTSVKYLFCTFHTLCGEAAYWRHIWMMIQNLCFYCLLHGIWNPALSMLHVYTMPHWHANNCNTLKNRTKQPKMSPSVWKYIMYVKCIITTTLTTNSASQLQLPSSVRDTRKRINSWKYLV